MITWFQRQAATMTVKAFSAIRRPGTYIGFGLRDEGRGRAVLSILEFYKDEQRRSVSPPLRLGEWTLGWTGVQLRRAQA